MLLFLVDGTHLLQRLFQEDTLHPNASTHTLRIFLFSCSKGLFTYYVSQNQGFLDPPSLLRQQWSAFGLPLLPPRQLSAAFARRPFT